MSISRIAAGIAVVFLLGVLAFTVWQNSGLRGELADLRERFGQVTAANAAQQAVISRLRELDAEKEAALVAAAVSERKMAARARHLDNQLRRAAGAQKRGDSVLSRDESYALCLRWLAAERRLPVDYGNGNAGTAPDGRNDSVAAFCTAWDGLTAEGVLIWAGQLMDQAGRFKARAEAARNMGAAKTERP